MILVSLQSASPRCLQIATKLRERFMTINIAENENYILEHDDMSSLQN